MLFDHFSFPPRAWPGDPCDWLDDGAHRWGRNFGDGDHELVVLVLPPMFRPRQRICELP